MFGKKNHLVGLDIGSRTIKLAEIEDKKKIHVIKKFGMIDISSGLIDDGGIRNPEEVADAIRQLFKLQKVKEKNVAISIGGFSIIVKTITLPDMPDEELEQKIKSEAEQYIPYDISDVRFDYQKLGPNPNNPELVSVVLVAAKKEMVNDYVNLIQLADLNPCIVDIDAFTLQNIYELNYEPEGESVALIDIGASKTTLNILKGTSSVFIRDVSLGCQQINLKIVSNAGCTPEEAERMYIGSGSDKISSRDLRDIVESVVTDWCSEIRRALDFFYNTYPDDQIGKIILSGGGANIKKFRELLHIETSSEVEVIRPFENFSMDSSLDAKFLEKIGAQAAIALGLAVRRLNDKKAAKS